MTSNQLLDKLMEDPADWKFDAYNAWNTRYKLSFWTANGLLFFRAENSVSPNLGIINTIILYYWLRGVKRDFIVNKGIKS